ncbi:hypothetical protein QR680_003742 [Steinernema hermaphroditum]|uniref:Uncharacterized protein n=1 Tax=Steinernema hermaphroditum TaxID=289476 RepID=A0AA39HMR9_9BILA|nr:hypothetical protein QR680_003742 [Steinernema hermaphroditum]
MSTQSTPAMPTHRGFSTKAREVLLDSPNSVSMQEQQAKLPKIESDGDVRKGFFNGCPAFRNSTDSQSAQKPGSSGSKPSGSKSLDKEFDNLSDIEKDQKAREEKDRW